MVAVDRLRGWRVAGRRDVTPPLRDVDLGAFHVSGELIEQSVSLVAHDLVATLGWTAERAAEVARREAEGKARIDRWSDHVEHAFPFAVAEETQQYLHDTFEDTNWPACPAHSNHPLWLSMEEAGLPTWRCAADDERYGRLGALETRPGV